MSKTGVFVFKWVNGWYWRVNGNDNWRPMNDETFCRLVESGKGFHITQLLEEGGI